MFDVITKTCIPWEYSGEFRVYLKENGVTIGNLGILISPFGLRTKYIEYRYNSTYTSIKNEIINIVLCNGELEDGFRRYLNRN